MGLKELDLFQGMSEEIVKVRRAKILPCMSCPICKKLLKEATTISECLHTFCKKCIYKKLGDEEKDCCPECKVHLGSVPVDKLRRDHNLDDISCKIFFPDKRRAVKAPKSVSRTPENAPRTLEYAPLIPTPTRRKERSLSSMLVSTPSVSPTVVKGITKSVARRAATLRGSSLSTNECDKKEEVSGRDCPESSGSRENLAKIIQYKRQHPSTANPNKHLSSDKDTENVAVPKPREINLRELLGCLPETEKRPKPLKLSLVKSEPPEAPARKAKRGHAAMNGAFSPELAKPQKMCRKRRKRDAASEELGTSSQATVDTAGFQQNRRPIWLTLLASFEQDQVLALPQIPKRYLRVRDDSAPVSSIQQYLAKKLDLTSESEVEITFRGQPVLPTVQLHDLEDFWLQTKPLSQSVQPSVSSSAKDFMMVLTYRRKLRPT